MPSGHGGTARFGVPPVRPARNAATQEGFRQSTLRQLRGTCGADGSILRVGLHVQSEVAPRAPTAWTWAAHRKARYGHAGEAAAAASPPDSAGNWPTRQPIVAPRPWRGPRQWSRSSAALELDAGPRSAEPRWSDGGRPGARRRAGGRAGSWCGAGAVGEARRRGAGYRRGGNPRGS